MNDKYNQGSLEWFLFFDIINLAQNNDQVVGELNASNDQGVTKQWMHFNALSTTPRVEFIVSIWNMTIVALNAPKLVVLI